MVCKYVAACDSALALMKVKAYTRAELEVALAVTQEVISLAVRRLLHEGKIERVGTTNSSTGKGRRPVKFAAPELADATRAAA